MRRLAPLPLIFSCLLVPSAAFSQAVTFQDDFECNNDGAFGDPAGQFGWEAFLRNNGFFTDEWRTDLSDGLSPQTDQLADDANFGAPLDWYENFIVTGAPVYQDIEVEVDAANFDDDWMGLVVRYGGPGSYYSCGMTRNQSPQCIGGGNVADGIRLYRVDTSQACANDYVGASTAFTYAVDGVPYQLVLMLPYVLSIVALALMARRARVPAALMAPYRRGER